jgi:hypothetical protein
MEWLPAETRGAETVYLFVFSNDQLPIWTHIAMHIGFVKIRWFG